MNTLPNLKKELDQEYAVTLKFIENYPADKNEFAPHQKSMKMIALANHIVEIFGWPDFMLKTEKLDFDAGDYQPTALQTKEDLLKKLAEDYQKSKQTLNEINENDLEVSWKMTMGEKVIASFNKYEAIRHALNQITHHRAQLGVYYRINDIPVPGSYGPSADEQGF